METILQGMQSIRFGWWQQFLKVGEQISLPLWWRSVIALIAIPLWVIGYYGAGYYGMAHVVGAVATPGDALIPVVLLAIVPYSLAYLQLFVCVYAIEDRVEFLRFTYAFVLATGVAFVFFMGMPTIAPSPVEVPSTVPGWALGFLQVADHKVNCFPSLHCTYAALSTFAFWNSSPKWRWWMAIFSLTVVGSTVLLHRHWLLCMPAGILLAACAYRIAENRLPAADR